jgi:uncharacterized membrane protein
MARITDQLAIDAPVERVFDTVADARNEPQFNPSMESMELLTPEPIGPGTRFRALMGQERLEMLVEITRYERPHLVGMDTVSSMMETSGFITFTPDGTGTLMAWDWHVTPKGWLRLIGPLMGPIGRRFERKIWGGLKRMLEAVAPTPER